MTWVLHGHPHDYWRFTTEALETLFHDAGFTILSAYYEFPCRIVSREAWHLAIKPGARAYLNSNVVARKPL